MSVVAASNLGGWPAVTAGVAFLIALGVILVGFAHEYRRTRGARRARSERERAYADKHPPTQHP
jgi:hypothetical protein